MFRAFRNFIRFSIFGRNACALAWSKLTQWVLAERDSYVKRVTKQRNVNVNAETRASRSNDWPEIAQNARTFSSIQLSSVKPHGIAIKVIANTCPLKCRAKDTLLVPSIQTSSLDTRSNRSIRQNARNLRVVDSILISAGDDADRQKWIFARQSIPQLFHYANRLSARKQIA